MYVGSSQLLEKYQDKGADQASDKKEGGQNKFITLCVFKLKLLLFLLIMLFVGYFIFIFLLKLLDDKQIQEKTDAINQEREGNQLAFENPDLNAVWFEDSSILSDL